VDFRVRAWYNPNLESRVYNVPAVMGNIVLMMTPADDGVAWCANANRHARQLMGSPLTPSTDRRQDAAAASSRW